MAKQPNFLIFITDQHRADWLGCYGHPVIKTPNIDNIASAGTLFKNFHVASPVCMPNRASLLTGRHPTQHGLRYNGCTLPLRANTFVDVLASAGYRTASIGKSHIQPMTDEEPYFKNPNKAGPIEEAWKSETGNYSHEEPGRYLKDGRYEFPVPYYGYQHVDMVTSHGDQCGGHYRQWFRENVPNWKELQNRDNELPHNYSCPQAYRTPIPAEYYPTSYIKNQTINYLKDNLTNEKPFYLFVSFPDPHHPFNPPGKYWDMYSPEEFEVNLPYSKHKNPTPPMQWMHQNWKGNAGQFSPQTAMMLDDEKIKQAMALTGGMISMVDDAIGEIMNVLSGSTQADNTIVCFNSDHGDYLGDFNMLLKGALPFNAVTNVPFIWADPQCENVQISNDLASTIDVSATILDRAGISPYNGMSGESLLPSLVGEKLLRDRVLIEYNDGGARLGFKTPARVRSIVTKSYKYNVFLNEDWGELYDLTIDPSETNNLWDNPKYSTIKAELSLLMNQELIGLMDESPRSKRPA